MRIHFNREESELLEELIKCRILALESSSQNNGEYIQKFEELLFIISDIAPFNYHRRQVSKLLGCVREELNKEIDSSKRETLLKVKHLLQAQPTD